jgi:hypothetical protein
MFPSHPSPAPSLLHPPALPPAVASRISRILAALDANPTATKLAPPTTHWLRALAPAVKWAPLRLVLANADNWVRLPASP